MMHLKKNMNEKKMNKTLLLIFKYLFITSLFMFYSCDLKIPKNDNMASWSTTIEIPIIQTKIDLDSFLEDSLISVNEDSIYEFNKTEKR